MSISRTRLSPAASRAAALEAARDLLIADGPAAVTLKAVAARVGRTHANLLHHFGSAAGLQQALAASMAERIIAAIGAAVLEMRAGKLDPRVVVDLIFDAFDREGGGALASWMILTGQRDALDPIVDAVHRLVDEIGAHDGKPVHEVTLALVLAAVGDALVGDALTRALGLPRDTARSDAQARIATFLAH